MLAQDMFNLTTSFHTYEFLNWGAVMFGFAPVLALCLAAFAELDRSR